MLRILHICAVVCSVAVQTTYSEQHGIYSYGTHEAPDERPHRKKLPKDDFSPHRRQTSIQADGEKLYLSPYIDRGQYDVAKELAKVDGIEILQGVESYAGYITVDRMINSNLWFWYFPGVDANVSDVPLIIWLQGGPGISSLQGLFNEIGPFSISRQGEIIGNKYSWGKNHSLLFIDNPIGTGFSFSDDIDGYATNQDTIGYHLYLVIRQFLMLFSELQPAPLVLVGEGYGGKHVISLARYIYREQNSTNIPINLQGIAIGNGLIDPVTLTEYSGFARQTGLVDSYTVNDLRASELLLVDDLFKNATVATVMHWEDLLNKLIKASHLRNVFNFLNDLIPMGIYQDDVSFPYEQLVQTKNMREALHVGYTQFGPINDVRDELKSDYMNSVKPWMEELLEHYRILCYSGQMDILVPYRTSVKIYESLHWSGKEEYQRSERKLWYHKGRLAGYHKSAGKFTEVLVRNAGHMAPADQPERMLALISSFARDVSLDTDTALLGIVKEKVLRNNEDDDDKTVMLFNDENWCD